MRTALLLSCLAISLSPLLPGSDADGDAFFEKNVRPILSERCADCHSTAKKVKGGLSLDSRADWMRGGDSGPAIVPGKPDESLLLRAVGWKDLDLQMPPKQKLSERELTILRTWVERGAPDPRAANADTTTVKRHALSIDEGRSFWSYAPLAATTLPPVRDEAWPRTDIDRFVLAGMEAHNLHPVADADPADLVRRLTFVLTGLPPTVEQLDTYVPKLTADRARALDELAVALMATPAFAERWASHWLDITRFAESSGGGRTLLFKDAWRFRDYVVQSFAENRPLDQMIREHLAGDLMPAADPKERARNLTATGFLALGPTIYEEQDKQRLRFDVIDEQLDTIGKAFLGQTISCARCHDHKFDPISQRDYYALAGIFASTRTLSNYSDNVVSWINAPLPQSPSDEQRAKDAEERLTAARNRVKAAKNELARTKDEASGFAKRVNQPIPLSEVTGIVIDDTQAQMSGMWKRSTHSPYYFGSGYVSDDNKDKGAKSLTFTPRLPAAGRYEVRLAYPALAGRATRVPVHIFHAMGDETVYIDQTRQPDIEGRFVSLGTFSFDLDGNSYVIVSNEGTTGFVVADLVQFLPLDGRSTSNAVAANSNEPANTLPLRDEIKQLEQQIAELTPLVENRPVVMSVRDEDQIGDTHIRIRGEVHQKAALVPRGVLSVLARTPISMPSKQSGRRELADWLVHVDNPLTARVLVNRVWTWVVGEGLVRSVDNFGTTGDAPTHPQLLDHLARRFQRSGWDMQALIRDIIRSRVWQLAVATQPADPDNRWLSHAHRRRLDAEQIRDAVLCVSGALDRTVGGPNITGANSAASESAAASAVEFGYQFTDVRRSLYTPAFRNNRLELFATFDFGDINSTQGQRHTTTVTTQALYFLNHPFVLEHALRAAQSTLTQQATTEQRLDFAFRQCLGRPAKPAERAACLRLLQTVGEKPDTWSMIYQSLLGSVDFRYLN